MAYRHQYLRPNGEDWSMKTKDTPEEIDKPNYFQAAEVRLELHDYIRITADINSPAPAMCWFRVDFIDRDAKDVVVNKIGDWERPIKAEGDRRPIGKDDRVFAIAEAIREFEIRNPDHDDRTFYDKDQRPECRSLTPFCGFPVVTDERNAAWGMVLDERAKSTKKRA